MVAHDDVKMVILVWDVMHIEMHIGPGRDQICPDDVQTISPIETLQETVLGCQVEHPSIGAT